MPEGEGATGTGEGTGDEGNPQPWIESIPEEHRETFKGFESREKLFETIGYTPPKAEEGKDWREGLSEEERKTADRFTDPASMVRSIQDLRKRESLVRVPGKDASEEEVAKFHKAIGVPETPEGYELKFAEGEEVTPEMEAQNKEWAQVLHKEKVPVETVNVLVGQIQKQIAAQQAQVVKDDADFVAQSEAELKAEWKGAEYDRNKTVANRAFKEIANRAGVNLEDLTKMETKEGRFIMDDPRLVRIFAAFGREMEEGGLGPSLTNDERETMEDQLTELRNKIEEAKSRGDNKTADRIYQKEMALIAKMQGNKKIA